MTRARVLVIYKRTTFERWKGASDPRVKSLLAQNDRSVELLEKAHTSHVDTVTYVREVLRDLGVNAVVRHKHRAEVTGFDLVLTVGGDGTLLWTSHTVGSEIPVLGINSSPETSVGYFCGATRDDARDAIAAALRGELRRARLSRMAVSVDGAEVHSRVLNDALFCHSCPAATTRFSIVTEDEQEQTFASSGIWVGPAAGSTAAQRSAGGAVLPLRSRKLQWVVREPFVPPGESLQAWKGLIEEGETLSLKTKIRKGKLFFDGSQKVCKVDVGSELRFTASTEPLTVLGLDRS